MSLNFNQTVDLVDAVGKEISVFVRGETGIGKSSVGYALKERHPNHHLIMFDCTVRSEGDVALPWMVEINGQRVTTYAPTELFGLHLDGPSIVCFDEITKGTPGMRNSVLPVLLERRVGVQNLHPDTIVFATGNLDTELLGDQMEAHAKNRMMDITMRKPRLVGADGRPDEWLRDYAIPRGAPVSAIGFCMEYPQIFQDYSEEVRNNPYIHKPGEVAGQFVTPRSFTKLLFNLLPKRNMLPEQVFYEGMVGLVGKACADSFNVYLKVEADLPQTVEVLDSPTTCRLPKKPVERLMMTYRLAQTTQAANIAKMTEYVKRLEGEMRALYCHLVSTNSCYLLPHLHRAGMMHDLQALRTA